MHTFLAVGIGYLALNFLCALLLHLHGLQQTNHPPRFLDILMHFLLLSAIGIPVLLVMTAEALFGRDRTAGGGRYQPVAQHR